jgi:hypothetical protein
MYSRVIAAGTELRGCWPEKGQTPERAAAGATAGVKEATRARRRNIIEVRITTVGNKTLMINRGDITITSQAQEN